MVLGENVAPKKKLIEIVICFKRIHRGVASLKMSLNQCQSMSCCIMETMNERGRELGMMYYSIMKGELG